MLARDFPRELRADFQQFYNLDVDEVGTSIRPLRAADLAMMLPRESRCAVALSPDAGWSHESVVLSLVEFRLHQIVNMLAGGKAKDGSKLPEPEPLYKPQRPERDSGMEIDEMREFLSRPRTVGDGD